MIKLSTEGEWRERRRKITTAVKRTERGRDETRRDEKTRNEKSKKKKEMAGK